MAASPNGFALRLNGTCAADEVDCGTTVSPYRACCPGGAFCPRQYNVNCCSTPENCTEALVQTPQCADLTWDLYDNGGYFCCLPGYVGYMAAATNSDGCGAPGYVLKQGEKLLSRISAGMTSTSSSATLSSSSTTSSAQTTSSSAGGESSSPSSSTAPSTHLGAIIGGTIGGLVALMIITVTSWLVLKKRKKMATTKSLLRETDSSGEVSKPVEVEAHHGISELDGEREHGHGRSELPA